MLKTVLQTTLLLLLVLQAAMANGRFTKRSYSDQSVRGYMTERTCWWNEVCKEEFQNLFRCKCPINSYCRSPGRYFNAYCSMAETGYIWSQPRLGGGHIEPPMEAQHIANIEMNIY